MSKETLNWLRTNTLTGHVKDHGPAWHSAVGMDNQFDGPVPFERIKALFDWKCETTPIYTQEKESGLYIPDPDHIATRHRDTGAVFGIFGSTYVVHDFYDWLVEGVAEIVDTAAGDVDYGSAGMLRMGAQAWVQIRPGEGVTIGGDKLVPWILASTSHDGSLATQYSTVWTRVVCDNTLAGALGRTVHSVRVKHTTNSLDRKEEARKALDIHFADSDEFKAEVEKLMNTTVTDDQFRAIVDEIVPAVEPKPVDSDGKVPNQQSVSIAANKRHNIKMLYMRDPRVEPWKGTLWGTLQAFNTAGHWADDDPKKFAAQVERQLNRTVAGKLQTDDNKILATANKVLAGV